MRIVGWLAVASGLLLCSPLRLSAQYSWQKSLNNPLIQEYSGYPTDPGGYESVSDPCVVYDSTTALFHMWFTSRSVFDHDHSCIASAISPDGEHWFVHSRNPVLKGVNGTWEENVSSPRIVRDTHGYKMY